MDRRTWTVVAAGLLALAIGVLGMNLPVPMVAVGPGPTYDTLGTVDDTQVVSVDGLPVFPTSGHLNMTTVSVTDGITMFDALAFWASNERRVVPRELIFPPNETQEEIERENAALFASSEANAESAAVTELGLPATVVVTGLVPDGAASGVLREGDQLLAVGGRPLGSVNDLTAALADTRPGDRLPVTYRRDGQEQTADVVLGASPDRPSGLLGVLPGAISREGEITISLGGIGGPSAGLMFALSLVDKLTPGELTGGRFVAGTGAILPNGVVTQIDGIPFKMHAAREAGATVFMVPAENCAEAAATVPDGLQLVRVGTLHDAVAALDALQAGQTPVSC
ncbi:signal protein PDZ [Pseudonocardia sp. CNS-139]|nr:signal protein PDZ [Pseudonocardia sp. CNS-139]